MDVSTAILVWLIVFLIVCFLARSYGIRVWSSVVLASFIALIVMFFVHLPASPSGVFEENGLNTLYALIVVITYLILIFYILEKSIRDRDTYTSKHGSTIP